MWAAFNGTVNTTLETFCRQAGSVLIPRKDPGRFSCWAKSTHLPTAFSKRPSREKP